MFLWLVNRKSILTKDNLLKRGWQGDKSCAFCGQDECIDHLFFQCSAARLVWSLLKCAFDLNSTPINLDDCFSRWIKTFPKQDKILVLVGVSAMFWSLWKCRNDMCFNRRVNCDPRTSVKLMCSWIFDWSVLQIKEPDTKLLTLGVKQVDRVASEIYIASQGWRPGVLRLGSK